MIEIDAACVKVLEPASTVALLGGEVPGLVVGVAVGDRLQPRASDFRRVRGAERPFLMP